MLPMCYLLIVFVTSIIDLGAINIGPDESPTSGSTESNIIQIFPIYNSGDHASDYFSTVTSSSSNAAAAASSSATATTSHDLKTEPWFDTNVPSSDRSINVSGTTINCTVPKSTVPTSVDRNTSACANAASGRSTTNPSPNLSTFVESFTAVVLTTPALQSFLGNRIPSDEIKGILYELEHQLFQEYVVSAAEARACEVSQAAALQDGFTLLAYFRAAGYQIGRFLVTKGIGIGPGIPQCYASLLENALLSYHIDSNEVLYQAFLDAFVNFIKAFGFDFGKNLDFLARLFTIELITLVNN